jgi:hypothetical protein
MHALHRALLTLAAWTWISSLSFWGLRRTDGENITRGGAA